MARSAPARAARESLAPQAHIGEARRAVKGFRERFWSTVGRRVAEADAERFLLALGSVQRLRVRVEELQSAALHFAGLPTRQDVRRLQRRVTGLRRRVGELDLALARLEDDLRDDPE